MSSKPSPRKVVINYPPVPTRKWKPPHSPHDPHKKKPFVRKPEFPHTEKLHPSTLDKIWHHYKMLSKRSAILFGRYSQEHLRFQLKSRGKQGAANCLIAIGFTRMKEMHAWDDRCIMLILELGNRLYNQSVLLKPSCPCTAPKDVINAYFIHDTHLVLEVDESIEGTLQKISDTVPSLLSTIKKTLSKTNYFVLDVDGKYIAIWKNQGSYYIFDPNDRDGTGKRCKDNTGVATVLKFVDLPGLVDNCIENCAPNDIKIFSLVPVYISKVTKKNLKAPENLQEHLSNVQSVKKKEDTAKVEPKPCMLKTKIPGVPSALTVNKPKSEGLPIAKLQENITRRSKPSKLAQTSKTSQDGQIAQPSSLKIQSKLNVATTSNTPSLNALVDPVKAQSPQLLPVEKPKPPEPTYFVPVVPDKLGIIRASYHQNNPNFSKFYGKQSLANAVAACAMLRQNRSKLWFSKILDEILLMGETIYMDSRRNMVGDQVLDIRSLTDKIKLNKKFYTAEIEPNTIIGKLNSNKLNILDLQPALEEFFTTNDTGIIRGPLTVAVWCEEGKFYMFDPNDRDKNGGAMRKLLKIGSEEEASEPGFACLIWFKCLSDLVSLYMNNIDKLLRREHFFISKIEIKDYVEKVVPWNGFTPLRIGKWIICGRFSQNNARFSGASRNTQCTAIATMSIVYSKLIKLQEWTRDTVDEIVLEGDAFYLKCVETLKQKNKFQERMLMMAEIINQYTLKDKEVLLEIEDCLVNGLLRSPDDFEIPNLKKGFVEFFRDNDAGVVTARYLSVAVWKDEDSFYYFDSHARNERGYSSYGGTACVLRVSTIEDLANIMSANLGAGAEDIYNIARVEAKLLEKTEEGAIKPEFNNYKELSNTTGILYASTYQGDEKKFDVLADKQTLPNIMVSLGMSTVYPSDLWTQDIMDEILKVGHELYQQSREENYRRELDNMPNWETEEEPINLELITTENVIPEFQVGVNKITFEFEEITECKVEPDKLPEEEIPEEIVENSKTSVASTKSVSSKTKIESESAIGKDKAQKKGSVQKKVPTGKKGGAVKDEEPEDDSLSKSSQMSKGKGSNRSATSTPDENKEGEEVEEPQEPTLVDVLKQIMVSPEDEASTPRNELIVQHDWINVAIWKQGSLFFLFDPKGRDEEGNAIGRETWSEKVYLPPEPEVTSQGEDALAGGDSANASNLQVASKQTAATSKRSLAPEENNEGEEGEEGEEAPEPIILDYSNAKSCTLMFTSIDDVTEHIINNIPPNKRDQIQLLPFKMTSEPALKVTTNPADKTAGNWNNFQEIDTEQWILRGTIDMFDKTFPLVNKGKQRSSICLAGCVFARLYATSNYRSNTVDSIIKYGDRLHTIARMEREKELTGLGLTSEEIATVMADFNVAPEDVIKKFYIGKALVEIDIQANVVEGDVTVREEVKKEPEPETVVEEVKDPVADKKKKAKEEKKEEKPAEDTRGSKETQVILSVQQGLRRFFEMFNFGILSAKDISVTVWKLNDMYYMFDPDSRGPYGIKEIIGTACITRFRNIERMSNIFLKNLERHGSNYFSIYSISIKTLNAEEPMLQLPKVTAMQEISQGKLILQGHFSQDNPKFRLKANAAGCTNALVALAMTMIHQIDTWTKPIIDDIITNGYNLYRISVNNLGYGFNVWEDKLILPLVSPEFNIGVFRITIQYSEKKILKGIIDIKSETIMNLRRGCEEFFKLNSKGVIQTEPLTVAIWKDRNLYYMFDPNPRCSMGLYTAGGTACLLIFKSIPLLTEHFLENVPKSQRTATYTITPIEITTEETEQKKKAPVKEADLLKVRKIESTTTEATVVTKKKVSAKKPVLGCSPQKKSSKKDKKSPCSCPDKLQPSPPPKPAPKHVETKSTINEKKQWARHVSDVNKQNELRALEQKMRQEFYDLGGGEAIVRAHYSQNSSRFDPFTRNKQSSANAVVAIVMSKLHDLNTWTYKNIEIILDSGDVLYKDSFIIFKPKDCEVTLKNLVRTFYILHLKIHVTIFKPSIEMNLECESLYLGLMSFFMDEKAGVLSSDQLTVAVFQKGGKYFMFDPNERDTQGLATKHGGVACLLKFNFIEGLVAKFFCNCGADLESKDNGRFTLSAVKVESIMNGTEAVQVS